MNERRKKAVKQILFGVVLLAVAGASYWFTGRAPEISTFAGCAEAGNPIMESYPRQCKTPDGKSFREDIGNELEKDDLIRVSTPRPNTKVTSPLTVKGMARGNWFFEASFPIKLMGASGKEIASGIAETKSNWMTTEFVPFEATLTFTTSAGSGGVLVLLKDNPSGLPENEDELHIPLTFTRTDVVSTPATKACVVGGCSGQICAEEEMMSTCEFREEYACYKTARCERQATGKCGWTDTPQLQACLIKAR